MSTPNTLSPPSVLVMSPINTGERIFFSKDDVYIYPSKEQSLGGILKIAKKGDSEAQILWDPHVKDEKLREANEMYALKVTVTDLRSLKRFIPTIGVAHLIFISKVGFAFPPLFFHSGGVREFLQALKSHCHLDKSDEEPNLFHISEYSTDITSPSRLKSSLDAMERSYSFSPNHEIRGINSPKLGVEPSLLSTAISNNNNNNSNNSSISNNSSVSAELPKVSKIVKNEPESVSWSVLEGFSKVTQLARSASQTIDNIRNRAITPSKIEESQKRESSNNSTAEKRLSLSAGNFELIDGEKEKISAPPQLLLPKVERGAPLDLRTWLQHIENGRIKSENEIRMLIHRGGIHPSIRSEVWKYLLGFFPFDSTFEERTKITAEKKELYLKWKSVWQLFRDDPHCKFSKLNRRAHAIEKDVLRTDRNIEFYSDENRHHLQSLHDILLTYVFFNYDLGYVQGMNELLSPILYVVEDESIAFWCFKGLMDSFESNFHKDQNGMHTQLVQLSKLVQILEPDFYQFLNRQNCLNMFFCFRWVLIHFKREFSFDQIQRLWEVMWSRHLTANFHLFICVAILQPHIEKIMKQKMEFDDMVKYMNDLSGKIDLEESLVRAEQLYIRFLFSPADAQLREEIFNKRFSNSSKPDSGPVSSFLFPPKPQDQSTI
eukprot:TRINITY_DN4381_c0_g1_i1.p1 TRINITY_DN4381_c0_g1~~TRINITY_DN4381_c0_g1_i1.p1  ORF type:complete len:660 (-),score=177.00 TRINITY_DN4381_c0_g1_i1:34-2013(-)